MSTRRTGPAVAVRPAGPADVERLAEVLAAAFLDHPGFAWCAPRRALRERHGQRFFEIALRQYLPKGEVHTTDDLDGVALWAPPDRWQSRPADALAFLPVILASTRHHALRTLRGQAEMERVHRQHTRPHRFLGLMGVDPAAQGRGLGSALLARTLAECDADGVPAYLEATCPRSRALYARHGFEVLTERHWPSGGPPWWAMWREPGAAQPEDGRQPSSSTPPG